MSSDHPPYPVLVGTSTPVPGPHDGAISRVYITHFELLRNYAAGMVGRDDAEDVVHDALIKFIRQLKKTERLGTDEELRERLFVMVHDVAINSNLRYEAEGRVMQLISGATAAIRRWSTVERRTEDDEITREVDAAKARLRPSHRRVWVLIQENDFDGPQAGQVMQVKDSTVRAHLTRAMDALQDNLTQRGLDPATRKQRRNKA